MHKYFISIIFIILFFSCKHEPKLEKKATVEIKNTDTTWKQLSLREKIGQIVCWNYNTTAIRTKANDSISVFLKKYPVGSIFMANWEVGKECKPDSIKAKYIKLISEFTKHSKSPLLFSEDFESGLGMSLAGFSQLPSEMGLGATNSPDNAFLYGQITASEARSIGINWLLNPVADLNMNPFNFLTNIRALGDEAERSVKMLPKQIRAMQTNGVAATIKHFPGDGTDFINQHFSTSKMRLSVKEWKQHHGKVFKTLIDSGVSVVMSGHISFPAYQKKKHKGEFLPATLSDELIGGLLKKELGFNGAVVSDALNMAGIAGYYDNSLETAIECFKAGNDILLWPDLEIIDTLEARFLRKQIPEERLNDAVNRIWNLKAKLGLFEPDYESIKTLNNVQKKRNKKGAYKIAKESITLISDKNKILPLGEETTKILLVSVAVGKDSTRYNVLRRELEKQGIKVTFRENLSFFSSAGELKELEEKYDKILFAFYALPGNPWGSLSYSGNEALSMWSANMLSHEKVISVCFGDPYKNLIYLPQLACRINCYNADENSQKALAELLNGKAEFSGILPVSYPK